MRNNICRPVRFGPDFPLDDGPSAVGRGHACSAAYVWRLGVAAWGLIAVAASGAAAGGSAWSPRPLTGLEPLLRPGGRGRELGGTGSSPYNCPAPSTAQPVVPPLLDACNWDELAGLPAAATPGSVEALVAGWQRDAQPPLSYFVQPAVNLSWGEGAASLYAPATPSVPLYAQVAPIAAVNRGIAAAAATVAASDPALLGQRFVDRDTYTEVSLALQTAPGTADFAVPGLPVPRSVPVLARTGVDALAGLVARWPVALVKASWQLNQVAHAGATPASSGLRPISDLATALQALTGQPVAYIRVTRAAERDFAAGEERLALAAAMLPGFNFDRVLLALVQAGRGGVRMHPADRLELMRDYDATVGAVVFAEGNLTNALGGAALRLRSHDGSFDQYLLPEADYAFLAGGAGGTARPTAVRLFDPRGYTYDVAAMAEMARLGTLNITPPAGRVVPTPEQLDALPRQPGGTFDLPWSLARRVVTLVVL